MKNESVLVRCASGLAPPLLRRSRLPPFGRDDRDNVRVVPFINGQHAKRSSFLTLIDRSLSE